MQAGDRLAQALGGLAEAVLDLGDRVQAGLVDSLLVLLAAIDDLLDQLGLLVHQAGQRALELGLEVVQHAVDGVLRGLQRLILGAIERVLGRLVLGVERLLGLLAGLAGVVEVGGLAGGRRVGLLVALLAELVAIALADLDRRVAAGPEPVVVERAVPEVVLAVELAQVLRLALLADRGGLGADLRPDRAEPRIGLSVGLIDVRGLGLLALLDLLLGLRVVGLGGGADAQRGLADAGLGRRVVRRDLGVGLAVCLLHVRAGGDRGPADGCLVARHGLVDRALRLLDPWLDPGRCARAVRDQRLNALTALLEERVHDLLGVLAYLLGARGTRPAVSAIAARCGIRAAVIHAAHWGPLS